LLRVARVPAPGAGAHRRVGRCQVGRIEPATSRSARYHCLVHLQPIAPPAADAVHGVVGATPRISAQRG
jgi:hypothetical protein